jgi:hypothetical protein
VSKPEPDTVTTSPVAAIEGENELIVGPLEMRKVAAVDTVVPAVVTLMVPVVAPLGTVAVNVDADAAVTAAVTPLNLTVLLDGVAENPVPVSTTVAPGEPADGVKPTTASVPYAVRVMPVVFPAASYWYVADPTAGSTAAVSLPEAS